MSKTGPGIAAALGAVFLGLGIYWTTHPPMWAVRFCGPTPCKFSLVVASLALLIGVVMLVMGVIALLHKQKGTVVISMGEQASQDAEALEKIQTSLGAGRNAESEFAPSSEELERINAARKELFAEMPKEEPVKTTTIQTARDPALAREKAFLTKKKKAKARR